MKLYVISEHQSGPCKIGFAVSPEKRLRTLQEANPRSLALEFQIECSNYRFGERLAHYRAGIANHIHGEWFNIPVSQAVAVVKQACYLALNAEKRKNGWIAPIQSDR